LQFSLFEFFDAKIAAGLIHWACSSTGEPLFFTKTTTNFAGLV